MTLAELLPPVNAGLNALSGVLLVLGWRAIRSSRPDRRERHRRLMLAACASSALFLVGYLTRVALTGTHRFPGEGALRAGYLALLGSHTILAAFAAPLALVTLWLGLSRRFSRHLRVARWTFPVWAYVSATGIVVYVMLYHVAPAVR